MQINLELDELTYLLHQLHAEQIVGLHDAALFPAESEIKQARLSNGLTALQEHGWVVATDDDHMQANDQVVLMAAVIANPEQAIATVHFADEETRQSIFYYLAMNRMVELYARPSGEYVLTPLSSPAAILTRLQAAFLVSPSENGAVPLLQLSATRFEQALATARAGEPADLSTLLAENGMAAQDVARLVATFCQLQPIGQISGIAIAEKHLQARGEIAILRSDEKSRWLAYNQVATNTMWLGLATTEHFTHLGEMLLRNL